MNSGLSCNMVKDLLPIYLDGIASEETYTCVKKHLSECKVCQDEYKKICETTEEKGGVLESEADSIKTLQKKIRISFITIILLAIFLTTTAIFYNYKEFSSSNSTIFDLIPIIVVCVGVYFIPLFSIFVATIWKKTIPKKTIPKKENSFWPNVIISFLVIGVLVEVGLLLLKIFLKISFYS